MSGIPQQTIPADELALDDEDREISPGKIALAVIIGRMTEFFDFFVYGIASVLVFPTLFFSTPNRVDATLLSFAVFALAFVARPLGSLVFMSIDRNYGRVVKLTVALFLLCGSTMAISFLPGHAQIGLLAPVLLALFRFGQGLGWGGAWDGLPSLLSLNAPENRRGWYAMIPQLGAALGFMLASGLFIAFISWLSPAEFQDWGWRFPFLVALALNVVALFARLRMTITPEFTTLYEQHELQPRRVLETVRAYPREILLGAFIPLATYAMFHLVTIFPLSWATLYSENYNPVRLLTMLFLGAALSALTMMLSGVMADRIGRRNQLAVAAVGIAIFSFFAAGLIKAGPVGHYVYVVVGFGLVGLSLGQASNAIASRFEGSYRYTGAAITSDIAWLIGAGFAPLVALGLCSKFGLAYIGYYLLSGAACTLIALSFSKKLDTTR